MIVTIHQPDLLPYSGFWFKMVTADAFIVAVHDQFQKHGYQRRVTMRNSWVSHRLVGKPSLVPINLVKVESGWQERLVASIRGRYQGARHWRERGPDLLDRITACEGVSLSDVNLSLIHVVRDLMDLKTPLHVTAPPTHTSVDRLIEQVQMVGGTAYLAGSGGAAYMGDNPEQRFAEAGLELIWSQHHHLTGDSIVSVLMDYDDPLAAVLNTCSARLEN